MRVLATPEVSLISSTLREIAEAETWTPTSPYEPPLGRLGLYWRKNDAGTGAVACYVDFMNADPKPEFPPDRPDERPLRPPPETPPLHEPSPRQPGPEIPPPPDQPYAPPQPPEQPGAPDYGVG